jgi:hypothetical protein
MELSSSQRALMVSTLLVAACLAPLRDAPDGPGGEPTGAVFLGAVTTAAGVVVPGAAGQINVYRTDAGGTLSYVGGQTFTTDGMGEFAETLVLAYAGTFEASAVIAVVPPAHLALRPDSASGTVSFTAGVTDTLRVRITLAATQDATAHHLTQPGASIRMH